jgi:hypothetical protein
MKLLGKTYKYTYPSDSSSIGVEGIRERPRYLIITVTQQGFNRASASGQQPRKTQW